jgi:hypothetical protein
MVEGKSVDYAIIHAPKIGISPYPPGTYTPSRSGRDPPCVEAVTIDGECTYICRYITYKREEFLL